MTSLRYFNSNLCLNILFVAGVNDNSYKREISFRAAQKGSQQKSAVFYQHLNLPCVEVENSEARGHRSYKSLVEVCSICHIEHTVGVPCHQFFSEAHPGAVAEASFSFAQSFICEVCHKGFVTKKHLRQHRSVHDSSYASCFICDVRLKHRRNITRHLESSHGLKRCAHCLSLYKIGNEYSSHLLYCPGMAKQPETQ